MSRSHWVNPCVSNEPSPLLGGFSPTHQKIWSSNWIIAPSRSQNRKTCLSWVFPKIGIPPKHPKMIMFSRKTPWLLGTTILGNPHLVMNLLQPFPSSKWPELLHMTFAQQATPRHGKRQNVPPPFGGLTTWRCKWLKKKEVTGGYIIYVIYLTLFSGVVGPYLWLVAVMFKFHVTLQGGNWITIPIEWWKLPPFFFGTPAF